MNINEAVKKHKLDRRIRWFSFCGVVTRNVNITMPCSGCSCDCSDGHGCNHGNAGCHECGYTGKSRTGYPCAALDENNQPIEVTDKDFTYAKKN